MRQRLAVACLLLSSACLAQAPPSRHQSLSVLDHVPTQHKVVALTIDLGESATRASVERLLKWLDQHHVHATFFVTGWFVRTYPDLARRLRTEGHDIGNHTDTHPHCRRVSDGQLREELRNVEELLRRHDLAMTEPRTFRPPFGEYDARVVRAAGELGYRTIMWSATTVDYNACGDASHCAQALLGQVRPGGIILTHATAVSAAMVPQVVTTLKGRAYEVVTLRELVRRSGTKPSASK
jgi:peptidoglycan-N-acetylglucosamine deacetylase